MPNHRTYRCPDCGHAADFFVPAGEWNTFSPECPECARTLDQEFVPFAVRGDRFRAGKIAEAGAIAQSEGPRIKIDLPLEDRRAADELIAHVREDISEHRATVEARAPAPQEKMRNAPLQQVQAAMPFGAAYRRATGKSPIESYQSAVDAGRTFDPNRLVGRRGL